MQFPCNSLAAVVLSLAAALPRLAPAASLAPEDCPTSVTVIGYQPIPAGSLPLPPNVLGQLSTRAPVGTGDDVLISGFIITGNAPKRLLFRALGPSLGLPGTLADPTLTLVDSNGSTLDTNDNWMNSPQQAEISATGYAPSNNLESAGLLTLAPGAYTIVVRGNGGTTGIATAEVIDVSSSTNSQLVNMSTRARNGTGVNILVAGFTIDGPSAQKVVIRGIGPSLPFSGRLADPTLQLRDSGGNPLVFNNNWKDTQQAEIQATGIAPTEDQESAIAATLAPGSYTAELVGACSGTGVALVEVFNHSLGAVSIPASSALPICVSPTTVVSRKSHGAAGFFDLNLPLTNPPGVECRSGTGPTNDFQIVLNFPGAVTFNTAAVTTGTGTVLSSAGNGTTTVTVNLTGVTNAQTITVTLAAVNDGTRMNDVVAQMGVLVGDTNGDGFVNAGDALQTRNRSGQATDATNFRSDVNADGFVNSGDTTLVRSRSGTSLP